MRDEGTEAALLTCQMRGWIEPLHEDMPTGKLPIDLVTHQGPLFTDTETVFRLTDGGWNALNRAHAWMLVGVVIAAMSLLATIMVAG
jgi:hypothetical protein